MPKKIIGVQKFQPQESKTYLLTDSCFWSQTTPEDYNYSDPSRKPHTVQLVDVETGTIVHLTCGSLVKIIKAN